MSVNAPQADIETLSKYQVLEPNRRVVGVYRPRYGYMGYFSKPVWIEEEGGGREKPYNRSQNSELIGLSTAKGQKRVKGAVPCDMRFKMRYLYTS